MKKPWHREVDGDLWVRVMSWQFWLTLLVSSVLSRALYDGVRWAWR